MVDASGISEEGPLESFNTINNELGSYDPGLSKKPMIVALNKMDIPGAEEKAAIFMEAAKGIRVLDISAKNRRGTDVLVREIAGMLEGEKLT